MKYQDQAKDSGDLGIGIYYSYILSCISEQLASICFQIDYHLFEKTTILLPVPTSY